MDLVISACQIIENHKTAFIIEVKITISFLIILKLIFAHLDR